jgi:hypothetical protein
MFLTYENKSNKISEFGKESVQYSSLIIFHDLIVYGVNMLESRPYIKTEILTFVSMNMALLWGVMTCVLVVGYQLSAKTVVSIYTPVQWFPKCAPRFPRDPRPVPRRAVDTFL